MLCAYCFRTITGNIFDPGKRAASNVTVDGVLGDPSADAYVGVWSVVLVAGRSRRLSNVFSPIGSFTVATYWLLIMSLIFPLI